MFNGRLEVPLRHEGPKRQLAGRRSQGSGRGRCVAEGTAAAWLKAGPARGRRVADESATAWLSRRRGPRRRMAGTFSSAAALKAGGVPQLRECRPRSTPRWRGWLLQGALMCHQKALVRYELQSSRTPVQQSPLYSPLHLKSTSMIPCIFDTTPFGPAKSLCKPMNSRIGACDCGGSFPSTGAKSPSGAR